MDEIQDTTVKGSILGSVAGSVALVQGKLGHALSINGINDKVRFGQHQIKCFHTPDACTNGSTFSYCLKWKYVPSSGFIMHSGGYHYGKRGYAHLLYSDGWMSVWIKSSSSNFQNGDFVSGSEKWVLIVQSWSPYSGIKLYVNGCIASTKTKAMGPITWPRRWSTLHFWKKFDPHRSTLDH